MSASTRTIQHPTLGGSIINAIAMAAIVLVAALSFAWGAANLSGTASVAAPAAAPVVLPRDSDASIGSATTSVVLPRDSDASTGSATTPVTGTYGAPGAFRPKDDTLGGSNQGAPAPRHAGPRAR